jgi:hypothetical protein
MEATIMKTMARTANIRRWLRRPECPEAIRQLKVLFDKCFVPANSTKGTGEFVVRKGSRRAYAKYDGVNFSGASTHAGNASIFYRPSASVPPAAGQIQRIEEVRTASGTKIRLYVRRYQPLAQGLYDPFQRYPHFHAKTFSSTLEHWEDEIDLDDIVCHAARFDYSHGRSVFVDLSRE